MDSKDRQLLRSSLKSVFTEVVHRHFQREYMIRDYQGHMPLTSLFNPIELTGYTKYRDKKIALLTEAGYISEVSADTEILYSVNMKKLTEEAPAYAAREDICYGSMIWGERPNSVDIRRLRYPMLLYVYFHQEQYLFEKEVGTQNYDTLYIREKDEAIEYTGMFRTHIDTTIKAMKPGEVLERISGLLITGQDLGLMVLRKSVIKEITDNAPIYAVRERHIHHGCAKQYLQHPEYFTYDALYGGEKHD